VIERVPSYSPALAHADAVRVNTLIVEGLLRRSSTGWFGLRIQLVDATH